MFGFRFISESEYEALKMSEADRLSLRANLAAERGISGDFAHRIKNLEQTILLLEKRGAMIDPFVGDPSPQDSKQYALYVAQVAGLYKDVLEPKLKHMIAHALHLLEESTNDRDYDQAVKGTVYALREMMRWGDSMVNKQVAIQTESTNQ